MGLGGLDSMAAEAVDNEQAASSGAPQVAWHQQAT